VLTRDGGRFFEKVIGLADMFRGVHQLEADPLQ
jgi:hypothetical protein